MVFPRLSEEASDADFDEDSLPPEDAGEGAVLNASKTDKTDSKSKEKTLPKEVGYKYGGPEPTKHGDWAHKGRVTDF